MYDISSLISHSKDMIFIDEVLEYDDKSIKTKAIVKENNPFIKDGALPHFVYLEIIAQSISALAGIRAKQKGEKLALNLLLGCRNFKSHKASVKINSQLIIHAKEILAQEDGFGLYESYMYENDILIAQGRLNVYAPNKEVIQ